MGKRVKRRKSGVKLYGAALKSAQESSLRAGLEKAREEIQGERGKLRAAIKERKKTWRELVGTGPEWKTVGLSEGLNALSLMFLRLLVARETWNGADFVMYLREFRERGIEIRFAEEETHRLTEISRYARRMMTVRELAALLGVRMRQVRTWVEGGYLGCIRMGGVMYFDGYRVLHEIFGNELPGVLRALKGDVEHRFRMMGRVQGWTRYEEWKNGGGI